LRQSAQFNFNNESNAYSYYDVNGMTGYEVGVNNSLPGVPAFDPNGNLINLAPIDANALGNNQTRRGR
jgi:hypothetical protein